MPWTVVLWEHKSKGDTRTVGRGAPRQYIGCGSLCSSMASLGTLEVQPNCHARYRFKCSLSRDYRSRVVRPSSLTLINAPSEHSFKQSPLSPLVRSPDPLASLLMVTMHIFELSRQSEARSWSLNHLHDPNRCPSEDVDPSAVSSHLPMPLG